MVDPRLIYSGGRVMEAILGGLGGPSMETRTRRKGLAMLNDASDDQLLDPREAMNQEYLAMVPNARTLGNMADKRYGFRTGASMKSIMEGLLGRLQGNYNQNDLLNKQARYNRKMQVAQALSNYSENEE